jgi:hypothetical protein
LTKGKAVIRLPMQRAVLLAWAPYPLALTPNYSSCMQQV